MEDKRDSLVVASSPPPFACTLHFVFHCQHTKRQNVDWISLIALKKATLGCILSTQFIFIKEAVALDALSTLLFEKSLRGEKIASHFSVEEPFMTLISVVV